ncbi:DNA-directed RNA polymerase subunit omega [Pelagibacteraceae bacterium]|nr:DNA-directed RNA polymerase subunit omega [Pelagibacteraceae bacterium]
MARITVEDCIKLINNQYDLVILAKERAVQLGRGATPAVDPENDKKPVIALREISESKITAEELKDSIVSKLRQIPDYEEEEELEEVDNDTFRQMYQGGLSKSEMEKSATRKFTARSPRVETRAKPIEDKVSDLEAVPMSSTDINESSDLDDSQDALDTSEIEVPISENIEVANEETTAQTTVDPIEENSSTEEESFDLSDQSEDTNENEAMDVEELTEITSDTEEDNTLKE